MIQHNWTDKVMTLEHNINLQFFVQMKVKKFEWKDFIKSIEHLFSKKIVTQVSLSNNFFKA